MNKRKALTMFLVPSIIGILFFMIPIRYGETGFFDSSGSLTIIVKVIADSLMNFIGYPMVSVLCVIILTISAVIAVVGLFRPAFLVKSSLWKDCFICSPGWVFVRILGCIFVWVTWLFESDFLAIPSSSPLIAAIVGADEGLMTYNLINSLVFVFLVASYLLPLLTDFGLLEYIGALLTKFMRPVFRVPGRAAVDCITS